MNVKKKKPDPVDIIVGGNIRTARKMRGFSQELLGRSVGVTFQQIQKYEKGTNRVSSSMLTKITRTLAVSREDLFKGVDENSDFVTPQLPSLSDQAMSLGLAFDAIDDDRLRKKIWELVKAIGKIEEPVPETAGA